MERTSTLWLLVVLGTPACYEGIEPGRPIDPLGRAANGISCEDLGYTGLCVEDVGIWYENGACQVRDCANEGTTCGLISEAAGYGCLAGPQDATTFPCTELGYEGECLSGDVLVWSEGSTCSWADCAAMGMECDWTDSVGYDCVESASSGDDPPGGDPPGGSGGGVLTVREILGGLDPHVSQDYGPTPIDYGYSYCHSYGDWGGEVVHCGVDIAIPHGTQLFVPAEGKVLIAGESAYYEDEYNPGAGELKIEQAHDGAQVILGHMTQIDLWTGQSVVAGQPAGLSGTANGPHLHLEVRLPDPNQPSGFRTVDPMVYFGW